MMNLLTTNLPYNEFIAHIIYNTMNLPRIEEIDCLSSNLY